MEDVEADDTSSSGTNSGGPIKEASSATDDKDKNVIYDWECFRKDKVWRHYNLYYRGLMIIVE
jgi:hypothetical protein